MGLSILQSSYNYDSNSNRTSQTLNGVTTTATYDDQDRLITFGNKTFTYNMNGEVTSMVTTSPSTTTDYVYDVFGNLKSVDLPSKTVNYKVDAHNRRFAKYDGTTLETFFVWNSKNQLIGLLDSSGNLTDRYVYGSKSHVPDYVEKGSDKFMIVTDHLGSPVQVINVATGTVAQEVKYDEFGNILSDTNPGFTAFGFAGCLYDQDTKLCRFGARDYDASIGRWLSKDAILFNGGDVNLYGYVMQDPINFIDPNGYSRIGNILEGATSFVDSDGGTIGASIGTVTGMAVGTFILPGVGSAWGGFIGGFVGGWIGNQIWNNGSIDPKSGSPMDPKFNSFTPQSNTPSNIPILNPPKSNNNNSCG